MKQIVDVIALERELENRLDVLNADSVFLGSDKANSKINSLIKRVKKDADIFNSSKIYLHEKENTSSTFKLL